MGTAWAATRKSVSGPQIVHEFRCCCTRASHAMPARGTGPHQNRLFRAAPKSTVCGTLIERGAMPPDPNRNEGARLEPGPGAAGSRHERTRSQVILTYLVNKAGFDGENQNLDAIPLNLLMARPRLASPVASAKKAAAMVHRRSPGLAPAPEDESLQRRGKRHTYRQNLVASCT